MQKIFSINPYSRRFSIAEQVIIGKEAGFDGLDYVIPMQDLFRNRITVQPFAEKAGIPILGLHCPIPFIVYVPSIFFNKTLQYFTNFPECKTYNFHLSGFVPFREQHGRLLQRFTKMAQDKNVPITFESNATHYSTAKLFPQITYMPEPFGDYCIQNKLPITFDFSHIAYLDYPVVDFYKKYSKHINLIHMSDYADKREHLYPGEGKLPLKELWQEMKNTDYKGGISFEIDLDNKDRADQIRRLKRSLEFLQ